jgi:hypothetical protein
VIEGAPRGGVATVVAAWEVARGDEVPSAAARDGVGAGTCDVRD